MSENKLVAAKLLGEIYRIQKRLPDNACFVGNDVIYGLLNGVERVVNSELEDLGFISQGKEDAAIEVLNEYFTDNKMLSELKGYYDIEDKLEECGIDRSDAIRIFTLLKAEGRFERVIEKMDSSHSPSECRTFDISHWDI
ncbi:hypothetical protein CSV71_05835 [Sporosarcina sp. P21c]|uniref:hypothetical protein n=1 Tax=unclassified Sporosarcina TaxID=2647733 RepID=UPI000C1649C9|nr:MULTISPECIES: hypothetical protein [unclassified Sporosarcina]PIC67276.1 hypothetical protein CSV78_08050 [Sporosarcina sp. P16a]PIC90220.1 hypothetical protein CSV71_05835 [Sporosarcina sp. P21c]PIC92728.1 hypothetical protein CSV70_08800 [Sporosarcina sp. P25]